MLLDGQIEKTQPSNDITFNIGKDAPIPECPIPGERYDSSNLLGEKFEKAKEYYQVEC